jgi:hypothetical protein
MAGGDTYRMTLMRACVLVGGEGQLARKFGVPEKRIVEWLLGEIPLPGDVFLRAVDVVLAYNTQHVQESKAALEAIKQRRDSEVKQ